MPDVDDVLNELDLKNSNSILSFGFPAQEAAAKLGERLLEGALKKDVDPVRDGLGDIIGLIRKLDVRKLATARPGFFGRLFGRPTPLYGFKRQFETTSAQIDDVAACIQKHLRTLMADIESLDRMHDDVVHELQRLEVYIVAGRRKIEHLDSVEIPTLRARRDAIGGLLDNHAEMEMNRRRDELHRRIHDLLLTRQLVSNDLIQIRTIQSADSALVAKARSLTTNTIALWKKQVHVAVEASRTQDAAIKSANDKLVATIEEGLLVVDDGLATRAMAASPASEKPTHTLQPRPTAANQ